MSKKNELDDYLSGKLKRSAEAPRLSTITPRPEVEETGVLIWADIEDIDNNPYQPRQRINPQRLRVLIDSLNNEGQLHAAPARPHPTRPNRYQLTAGHRRKESIRAGANAGSQLSRPDRYIGQMLLVLSPRDDAAMLEAAFAENEAREDFSVFDVAHYYRSLQELTPGSIPGKPPSWEELITIRHKMGKPLPLSARQIRRIVEVLDLPEKLQDRLAEVNLSDDENRFVAANEKHCRALLSLQPPEQKDPKAKPNAAQLALMAEIEKDKISGNAAMRRVAAPPKKSGGKSSDQLNLEVDPGVNSDEETDDAGGPSTWFSSEPGATSGADNSSANTSTTTSTSTGASGQATQGFGMFQGGAGTSSRSVTVGLPETDIAGTVIEPAMQSLADLVGVLPNIGMTPLYKTRVRTGLAEIKRLVADIEKILERRP